MRLWYTIGVLIFSTLFLVGVLPDEYAKTLGVLMLITFVLVTSYLIMFYKQILEKPQEEPQEA